MHIASSFFFVFFFANANRNRWKAKLAALSPPNLFLFLFLFLFLRRSSFLLISCILGPTLELASSSNAPLLVATKVAYSRVSICALVQHDVFRIGLGHFGKFLDEFVFEELAGGLVHDLNLRKGGGGGVGKKQKR